MPEWISERLGLEDDSLERARVQDLSERELAELAQETMPISLPGHPASGREIFQRARVAAAHQPLELAPIEQYSAELLCRGCDDLRAEIEQAAQPLVLEMLEAKPRLLSPAEQRQLAAWATNTGYIVLALEGKGRGVPKEHRVHLRERREPHPHVFVGLGHWPGSRLHVLAARMKLELEHDGQPAGSISAYTAVCVFGGLVVRVFGVRRPPASSTFRMRPGLLAKIWPLEGDDETWPPLWDLDELAIEDLFKFNHLRIP